MTLDDDTPASYSHQLGVIFFRADFPEDVERCAIAHEIVHFEYNDDGKSRHQEDRADRIATLRLIRPSRLARIMRETNDYAEAARELRVTEKTMRLYLRMARNGTLPKAY
jgi:Zn-dependent peptidase ImmA (M78 family)